MWKFIYPRIASCILKLCSPVALSLTMLVEWFLVTTMYKMLITRICLWCNGWCTWCRCRWTSKQSTDDGGQIANLKFEFMPTYRHFCGQDLLTKLFPNPKSHRGKLNLLSSFLNINIQSTIDDAFIKWCPIKLRGLHQNESCLSCLRPPWRKERARKAALILMRHSIL